MKSARVAGGRMWPTAQAVGSRRDGVEFKPRQGRQRICARAVVILSPLPGLKKNLRVFLNPRLAPWATFCRP
jgi:hypothetical protein